MQCNQNAEYERDNMGGDNISGEGAEDPLNWRIRRSACRDHKCSNACHHQTEAVFYWCNWLLFLRTILFVAKDWGFSLMVGFGFGLGYGMSRSVRFIQITRLIGPLDGGVSYEEFNRLHTRLGWWQHSRNSKTFAWTATVLLFIPQPGSFEVHTCIILYASDTRFHAPW